MNGCKITYESGSFYAVYGSVKKWDSVDFTISHNINFDIFDEGGKNHTTIVRFNKNEFTKNMVATASGYVYIYVDGINKGTGTVTISNQDNYKYIEFRGYSTGWSAIGTGTIANTYGI